MLFNVLIKNNNFYPTVFLVLSTFKMNSKLIEFEFIVMLSTTTRAKVSNFIVSKLVTATLSSLLSKSFHLAFVSSTSSGNADTSVVGQ